MCVFACMCVCVCVCACMCVCVCVCSQASRSRATLSCDSSYSQLFLIGSISYLLVTMTYMRAWMSLKFGQISLLVSMATDRVMMEKWCCHFFSAVFYPILFILAGNDDMHESSEEFEIRPVPTTDCGVSCP